MRKKSIKSRKYRGHSPSKRQNILIFHQNPLQHPISALSASHVIIYCGWRKDQNTTISGPFSARQRNAIRMAFLRRVDDGTTLNAGLVAL